MGNDTTSEGPASQKSYREKGMGQARLGDTPNKNLTRNVFCLVPNHACAGELKLLRGARYKTTQLAASGTRVNRNSAITEDEPGVSRRGEFWNGGKISQRSEERDLLGHAVWGRQYALRD